MLRSAIGRPRGASSQASTFSVCRSHRHHNPARATPALRPTTGEEGRPTPPSKAAQFDVATSASTRNSRSRTGRGVAVTARANSRGFSRCLDLNFGRLTTVEGGKASVYSLARAGKSTATALGEENREGSPGGDGGGDLTSFRLTDIGEGIMEVEVLRWFVAPGDHVRQFDKLCEVQSDKATVEITSRYEGVVRNIRWSEGDMVQTGDVLVDIEEVADGRSDGSSIPSQALLSSADESGVPKLSVPPSSAPAQTPAPTPAKVAGEQRGGGGGSGGAKESRKRQVLATPAVRRVSRELSVDLSLAEIAGTGAGGRVLKADVLAYAAAVNGNAIPANGSAIAVNGSAEAAGRRENALFPSGSSSDSSSSRFVSQLPFPSVVRSGDERIDTTAAVAVAPTLRDPVGGVGEEGGAGKASTVRRRERKESVSVPIRGVQRAMMEAMKRSLEVPHMTFCDEVNADRLSVLRSDLKDAAERRGIRLSYLPLVVKATSMALTSFPALNASLSEDESSVFLHPDHNIGVAMDTKRGLLVPCISAVQEKSILEIAEELNELQRLGAAGKLGEEELSGTTFTLSNIGSIGGTYASPVILHPQVCIGALGRMQRVPRFDPADPGDDRVVAARVFPASWSADHRVVDGGTLARFSNLWKAYLENPARMLADTR